MSSAGGGELLAAQWYKTLWWDLITYSENLQRVKENRKKLLFLFSFFLFCPKICRCKSRREQCACLHCLPPSYRAAGWQRCCYCRFLGTAAWSAHTRRKSAFLPLLPMAFAFLEEAVVVFQRLLTSTKLPDGISMLCKETGAFYYWGHVDLIHLHSQKWSEAFANCTGNECSAPSRDPEGLLWDIVTLSRPDMEHA